MDRKKLISLIAGILVAVLIFGLVASVIPMFASAATNKSSAEIMQEINDLKDKQAGIEEEINGLESDISANMSEIEQIVAEKNKIDQEVFLLHQKIDNINDQIAAYNDLIVEKQEELDAAQLRLNELNEKNKERIRAMEEDGNISYWSVLFKANSFSDLLDRLDMVEEIAASDRRRIQEMSDAAAAVAAAKENLTAQKTALQETKAELTASQKELEEKRAEADALLQQLVAKGMQYQELLDAAEDEIAQMTQELSTLNSQYDEAKDREYQEWLASLPKVEENQNDGDVSNGEAGNPDYGNVDDSGVTWLLPINYTAFTSPFGYREHPVYGGWKFHYGVDLAAPTGTPIYATRGGQVTTATYGASGGYFVYINHMDGYTSQYLHMTHFVVSAGEYVSAGQLIGYCGSTGASTGSHLHFGISKNGVAVNPALYIPI